MRIKLSISLTIITLTVSLFARQDPLSNKREIYISSSAISAGNFGIQYKSGLNENTLIRLALISINTGFESFTPAVTNEFRTSDFDMNGGFEVGLEKRFSSSEKLKIFYGIDLICNSGYGKNISSNPNLPEDLRALDDFYIYPGLGFKSGVILNIKNDFFISAELSPHILYKYNSHERIVNSELRKDRTTGFDLNLNNESIRISLIYRWAKM